MSRPFGTRSLLSHTTDGTDSDQIDWTTPDELEGAANRLRDLVESGDASTRPLLELYEADANGVEELSVELARDLDDIAQIAGYARGCGAAKVTLGYYW